MSFDTKETEMEEGNLSPLPTFSPSSSTDSKINKEKEGTTVDTGVPLTSSESSLPFDEEDAKTPLKKLTLSDLKRAIPLETEAETSILSALDEAQGEEPEDNVFRGVPDTVLDESSPAKVAGDLADAKGKNGQQSLSSSSMSIKQVPKKQGWTFAVSALTKQLEAMQDQAAQAEKTKGQHQSQATCNSEPDDFDPDNRWNRIRQAIRNDKEFPPAISSKMKERELPSSLLNSSSGLVSSEDEEEDSTRNKRRWYPGRCCRNFWRDTKIVFYLTIEFFKTRSMRIKQYCRRLLIFTILGLAVASILFYGFDNPVGLGTKAAISWWLLFFLRQMITFSLARLSQVVVIDLMCLQTKWMLFLGGSYVTLLIVLSKGWPFVLFAWGVFDLCLLYGDHAFVDNWLYYQDAIKMCNAENPSGGVPGSTFYGRLLASLMIAAAAVACKRFWLSTHFGQQTSERYGSQLTEIIHNILLISEVASLSRVLEEASHEAHDAPITPHSPPIAETKSFCWESFAKSSVKTELTPEAQKSVEEKNAMDKRRSMSLRSSEKRTVKDLLNEWEEPDVIRLDKKNVSIKDILQFKNALNTTSSQYPFTLAFGKASTRDQCIDSSVEVYERLLSATCTADQHVLSFDTICVIAMDSDGKLDKAKTRALVRLFRPERNGDLTKIDFVQSCDAVYKSLRLLQAAVANSSQIDKAFETIFNGVFYTVLFFIILALVGLDPIALFVGLSGIIVGFAFMIGSASAKYFEGILFILARRPYEIGDRIAVSDIEKDTDSDGSSSWFVEGVTLFKTTVRFAVTNEVATYSNGSLADSRIINAARSPKAIVYINLKVDSDIPSEKINVFHKTIESFVKDRPREWIGMTGFRATRAEADLGYVEYSITLQHRESWQKLIAILESKSELSVYCSDVQIKLGMKYIPPPLPVNLSVDGRVPDELLGDAGLAGPPESKKTI